MCLSICNRYFSADGDDAQTINFNSVCWKLTISHRIRKLEISKRLINGRIRFVHFLLTGTHFVGQNMHFVFRITKQFPSANIQPIYSHGSCFACCCFFSSFLSLSDPFRSVRFSILCRCDSKMCTTKVFDSVRSLCQFRPPLRPIKQYTIWLVVC